MLKKRDAQGLSITFIIVAVLGLIVLVILLVIFTKESGKSVSALESCGARGGDCVSEQECEGTKIPNVCKDRTEICCVNI